jgi:hypothetical protein
VKGQGRKNEGGDGEDREEYRGGFHKEFRMGDEVSLVNMTRRREGRFKDSARVPSAETVP